jgi:hypothetical protein
VHVGRVLTSASKPAALLLLLLLMPHSFFC